MQHNTFAESLEWVVADSPTVIRARLESAAENHELTFKVLETIKGMPKVGETIELRTDLPTAVVGQELILLLAENKNPLAGAHPFRIRFGPDLSWLTLDGNTEVVLMDYRRITRGREILEATRKAAAYPSVAPAKKLQLRGQGTGNRNLSLIVPIDSRLEKLAQEWASGKDFELRMIGLEAIRPFKSQKNIEIVRRALDDTRSRNPSRMSKYQMAYYDVRADAMDVLHNWDVWPPELPNSGPILLYQRLRVSMMQMVVIGSIVFGWWLVFYLLARWGRSRGMDLGFWRLNFTAMSFVLAVFAGWIWIRSHAFVDELLFPLGQSQHQIASYNGGIQYVVVREWTLPSMVVVGHFDQEMVEDQWALDKMNGTSKKESLGFVVSDGLLIGPAHVIHPFTLFRMPFWILVVPLSLVFVMGIFRIGRLVFRIRRGLCRRCGYDLRESRGGPCPECGTKHQSGKSSSLPLNELLEQQQAHSGV
jgi:hypothetical protein